MITIDAIDIFLFTGMIRQFVKLGPSKGRIRYCDIIVLVEMTIKQHKD